jgi:hypothetical protein
MDTTTKPNGQPRRTLASQIDRLDQVIDALADGLNQAVATAVEQAVGAAVERAVQAVLTEVLTNVELQNRLRQPAQPAAEPKERRPTKGPTLRAWDTAKEMVRRAAETTKNACLWVAQKSRAVALVAAGVAIAAAYAARSAIRSAAGSVCRWGVSLIGKVAGAFGWMTPAFAFAT